MNKLILITIVLFALTFLKAQTPINNITETPIEDRVIAENTIPPKIVLGMAYVPTLADVDPNEWTYVREHLEGAWLNMAKTGKADTEKIIKSLTTKNFYYITNISAVNYDKNGVLKDITINSNGYNALSSYTNKPQMVLVNDYVTKDGKNPLRYYGKDYIAKAKAYAAANFTTDGKNPFKNRINITVRGGHFNKNVYDKTYDPEKDKIIGRAFSTMSDVASKGGGIVFEKSPVHFLNQINIKTYLQAYNRAKELGGRIMWLAPRGHTGQPEDYSKSLVETYEWFKKNKCFPDELVIINYSRTAASGEIDFLSMTPMINDQNPDLPAPGSFIGAMYWGIKQREKALESDINAGTVSTLDGKTEVTAFINEDETLSNPFSFKNENSTPGVNYNYLIVRESDGTILVKEEDSHNFQAKPIENQLVYGIAFKGKIIKPRGKKITDNDLATQEFAISKNAIRVIKVNADTVSVKGGTLSGGPFEFCMTDTIPDQVSGIKLVENSGQKSKYIVSANSGLIIKIFNSKMALKKYNFSESRRVREFIYHLSYNTIQNLEEGMFLSSLEGNFDLSNPILIKKLTNCERLGLNKDSELADKEITLVTYPNPFDDQLILSNVTSNTKKAVLYDYTGKRILENDIKTTGELVINTTSLRAGVYFLKVFTSEGKNEVLKLIKE